MGVRKVNVKNVECLRCSQLPAAGHSSAPLPLPTPTPRNQHQAGPSYRFACLLQLINVVSGPFSVVIT